MSTSRSGPSPGPGPTLRPVDLMPVSLAELVPGAPDVAVHGVSLDSRTVLPGDLYVGLAGHSGHGAAYAAQAVAAGAIAVLTDAAGSGLAADAGVPVVVVDEPRRAMAGIAATVYGHPGDQLDLFAITGTTGKTSTTHLLAAALTAAGRRVATIGTLGFSFEGVPLASGRTTVTTPESPDLQALLAYLLQAGADAVAMEVSSHALALHRVDALVFDVAGFTNLGRDHLDFHINQEDYFQAKASLFRDGRTRMAVVSIDDDYGRRLVSELRSLGTPVVTTGESAQADYRPMRRIPAPDGRTHVLLGTPGGDFDFELSMLGEFNIRNAVTAAAMVAASGIDLTSALPGLAAAQVPGRMQRVTLAGAAPEVVVDFAHTPEAVAAALAALPAGRRVAVLGCGGDRDQAKRGPMGAAAASGAEIVVVTDDNPRSEDPATIRRAVLAGARQAAVASGAKVYDGGPRLAAIRLALSLAQPGDWVAILGKGHETGQQIGGSILPFDDASAAISAWTQLKEDGDA